MPKRILIIGLLYCLAGVAATWGVVSNLMKSRIDLNLAILMLPVGIGLLRGNASSQWWARFWLILGYCFCALMIILAIATPQSASVSWFELGIHGPEAVPYVIAAAVLLSVLFYVVHKLLYSQRANTFFRRESAPA